MDTVSLILYVTLGVLFLGIIGVVAYIIHLDKQYKHRAIIKKPVNGGVRTVHDRFSVKVDTAGNEYYKFRNKHNRKKYANVAPLPDECIETTDKNYMTGTWYDVDGSLIPAKDNFSGSDKQEIIAATQPFNANQRSFYINQYQKAERDKKKSWQEVVMNALPFATLIILIVISLVMLPDIFTQRADYDAARENRQIEILELQQSIVRELNRVANDEQVLLPDNVTRAVNSLEAPN